MKKFTFLLTLMLLTLGIGSAWAADVVCDFTAKSASHSAYTDSWKYGDFTVFGGANNNKGWAYVKMGGKKENLTSANPVYISSPKVASSVSKVQVSIIAGSLGKSGMSVNSWGVYVYSDASMTNQIDYVAGGTITKNAAVFELTPSSGSAWSANNYYKVSFDLKNTTTTNGIVWLDKITFVEATETPDPGTPPATTYTVSIDPNIENGTVIASPTEAAEGATVTLTATPDANYNFGSWTVKDASDADVAVTGNTFTMPASNVTVSASFVEKSKYTITWNVAEGSVAPTQIYEGDALGTLPTADNCSSGKVFVGWTEASSVNADGSGLVLAKSTDVPAGDKTYNAVYAVQETGAGESGSADVVLADGVFDSANKKITWTTDGYATILQVKGTSGNDVANYTSEPRWYVGHEITFTPQSGVNITKIVIDQGATAKYQEFANATITNANVAIDGQTVTLTPENGSNPVVIVPTKQLRPVAITIYKGAAISNSNYSLDCEANNEPFLTVAETPIDFGTLAKDETATETFTVTGGYLAENVTLTISGTDASFFSVSPATIAKADEVNETVTVTYNPTEVGDHTATLTIKTGDITKEIALSGNVLAPGKWVLVKDVATLSAGDEIIIAAAEADYAIGEAASNNYKGAAITKVGETAVETTGVTVLTVEETGVAEAPYAFKAGSNYLYAASSSANQLKGKTTLDDHGKWVVTITEGVASIVAAKSSNRNVMQYNPNSGSPIFACYETASQKALAIYRNSENVVKPVISGEADFVGSTQVTITTQSGLTVYYTTDGTDPNNTSAQYTAPFTINATTTVKAIAYDASSNASGVAEMTFTKHDLVNVATAMALEKDEIAYFDEFEVVKVVTGTQYIYIKDASGHGLIYDLNLATQLSDGDRVQGFVGISAPYGGLPEAKPVDGLTVADLTITSGVATEPYDFTSTATAADINKYVVFNDVEIATAVSMSNSNKEFSLTINGSNVAFYNQFSIEKTLEAGKTYDIYGFVSIYNEKLQVYFYQALEEDEVVTKYTVTYNAGGATGEVPVDNNEYTEGAQVYLKSATSLTKEGYDYKGWKVTDEGGNEITVSSNKFNMPASNVTVTAQWEEIVVTSRQDFSNGYWVLVTEEGQLAPDDKIVVAAVEEDYAMKSYESGNNIKHLAITKLGDKRFLKWTSEVGVFQLASSGSGYTIQDVNTEEYLYAAGTGDKNYLKATDEVPSDAAAAKPYIWTISYTDGVATVKATSDNHNDLQYNKSADIFSCYASTQGEIALYKHVENIDATLVTPSVVEQSYFSVGNNKYVQFSTGNLQYEVGTNTWSFASEQYEVIGGAAYDGTNNTNFGMNVPGYTGKLDLFAWSADGKFGVNPSNKDADYQEAFVDWGTLVNESGWCTLTQAEMRHILDRKKDGKKLWALATVNGLNGLILLPDNWNTSLSLVYGYVPTQFVYTENQLTDAQWEALEAEGAVFLPAGGSRTGGYGNEETAGGKGSINANGHYFHVDNVGVYGYYWLNTQDTRPAYPHCASFLMLPGWDEGPTVDEEGLDDLSTPPVIWSREKRRGNSVRLVKEVTPNYTRDKQGAGVYGTVCYPENIVWCDGGTLYEVAGKEGNKVIFDEVTTPEAGMPYIFIADQEVLNFFCGTDEAATAGEHNSLQGTFTQIDPAEDNVLVGNYMLVNNIIKKCGVNCGLYANRAYFIGSELESLGTAPSPIQGRRRISLEVTNENTATGIDGIVVPEGETVKVIVNGQLIIIRGGEKFNAQGQRL